MLESTVRTFRIVSINLISLIVICWKKILRPILNYSYILPFSAIIPLSVWTPNFKNLHRVHELKKKSYEISENLLPKVLNWMENLGNYALAVSGLDDIYASAISPTLSSIYGQFLCLSRPNLCIPSILSNVLKKPSIYLVQLPNKLIRTR